MKYIIKLSLALLLILSVSSLQGAPKHTAQRGCTLISEDGGFVSLRVIEYGAKAEIAVANAMKLAIETILFRGIENSKTLAKPLIGTNEDAIIDSFKDYFKDFFENQRHQSFIASSFIVTPLAKDVTKHKYIVVDIRVNIKALKTDLETNKIIRKFGF